MVHDVRVEQRHSRPLAVVRRLARPQELSKVVPDACGLVWGVIRDQGGGGAGRHVAVYLDSQINLEVGVEVDAPFAGRGEVVASGTPDGLVAVTTHYGPYGRLHEAHEAIHARAVTAIRRRRRRTDWLLTTALRGDRVRR